MLVCPSGQLNQSLDSPYDRLSPISKLRQDPLSKPVRLLLNELFTKLIGGEESLKDFRRQLKKEKKLQLKDAFEILSQEQNLVSPLSLFDLCTASGLKLSQFQLDAILKRFSPLVDGQISFEGIVRELE